MNPDHNLASLLWQRAITDPQATFMLDDTSGQDWTYGQAASAAHEFGQTLRPGTTGIMMANCAAVVVAAFAALSRGNTVALLNPAMSAHEREGALADAAVTQLVTSSAMVQALGSPGEVPVVLADQTPGLVVPTDPAAGRADPVAVSGEEDAVLIFTSGTTGRAKAAVLTHQRVREAATSLALSLKGRPGPYPVARPEVPPNLLAGPIAQTGGLNTIVFALVVGRRLLIIDRFKPARVLELAATHSLDTFVGTPTMLQMLATHEGDQTWPTLRTVISGGAPLTAAVQERFERRFSVPVTQVYGQTETGYIAGYSAEDIAQGRRRAGSVGRAYPDVEIVVHDAQGRPVPTGESGEVVVRTPFSMRGYLAGGEQSASDEDGWVATGDLGRLDDEGYLYLVGRARELIICGGFNIYPAEIEQALLSHNAVLEAAAFGIPDERLGEVPVAVVEARPGLDPQVLVAHVRERLAHYKAPREIRVVLELPRTESNKILKRQVRDEWLASMPEQAST